MKLIYVYMELMDTSFRQKAMGRDERDFDLQPSNEARLVIPQS